MTDVSERTVETALADERISFRGPLRRMLVTPEVGALIGAILVWVFFWSVGTNFSTASGTASYLDIAAPLGIMAVAVALLMIGGEFDLSSGVMTGASGILVGLLVRTFMGEGASLFLAVPVAFIVAGCVGWFNGTLVNRTGLPSFIVTLGTFFMLRGANLVFAKRLSGKVLVDGIDEGSGFEVFRKIFASVHKRPTFGSRDALVLALVSVGAVALSWGLLELSLVRRNGRDARGVLFGTVGLLLTIVGFVMLLRTTGVSANTLWGTVAAIGLIVALVGLARAFFETTNYRGTSSLSSHGRTLAFCVACVAAACAAAFVFDRNEPRVILSWMPHPLRLACALLAAAAGVGLVVRRWGATLRQRTGGPGLRGTVRFVLLALLTGALFVVGTLSFFQLTTEQAMRAIAVVALGAVGLLNLLRLRGKVAATSKGDQLIVGVVAALGLLALAFVARADSSAIRFRTGLFTAMVIMSALLIANTVIESQHVKRTSADLAADRRGRRAVAIGAALASVGLIVRLFFTNVPFRISILWWFLATALATFVLIRTKYGNWIFAVGGNKEAARSIGVPVDRVKVALFVTTALAGCFVGMMTTLRLTTVQASQGIGEEFEYIIAAVVGGNLLTGGYGSAAGASVGAVIMAMSIVGIPYARWNSDGRFIFLGAVLLLAVLVNNYVRRKAQEAR